MKRARKVQRQVNVHEAKTGLSKLLLEVERGGQVIIARSGTPVAKLVPFPAPGRKTLSTDTWKGRIRMAADFDAPMSDEELREWSG